MIKVAVADNYPVLHHGLRTYFKNHLDISITANVYNYAKLEKTLSTSRVDVLIIDFELEGLNNVYDIKNIVANYPKTKVLVFSNQDNNIEYFSKTGVSNCVCKTEKISKLEQAIIDANNRKIVKFDQFKNRVAADILQKKQKKLTVREQEIMNHLLQGKRNNEIAYKLQLDQKTISTFKMRILKKMNVNNLVDLIYKTNSLDFATRA